MIFSRISKILDIFVYPSVDYVSYEQALTIGLFLLEEYKRHSKPKASVISVAFVG